MKFVDARFVRMADGRKVLQLQRSLWGGEGSEWFTPPVVDFDSLENREQDELLEALGETEAAGGTP